jgi:hypothetical protein
MKRGSVAEAADHRRLHINVVARRLVCGRGRGELQPAAQVAQIRIQGHPDGVSLRGHFRSQNHLDAGVVRQQSGGQVLPCPRRGEFVDDVSVERGGDICVARVDARDFAGSKPGAVQAQDAPARQVVQALQLDLGERGVPGEFAVQIGGWDGEPNRIHPDTACRWKPGMEKGRDALPVPLL